MVWKQARCRLYVGTALCVVHSCAAGTQTAISFVSCLPAQAGYTCLKGGGVVKLKWYERPRSGTSGVAGRAGVGSVGVEVSAGWYECVLGRAVS